MANRRISIVDLVELVRLLRAGESDRTLTRVLRHNRRTIARYRVWAQEQGLLVEGSELPSAATSPHQLRAATLPVTPPPQQESKLAAYREQIAAYRTRGMEMAAIRARLEEAAWASGQLQRRAPAGRTTGAAAAPGRLRARRGQAGQRGPGGLRLCRADRGSRRRAGRAEPGSSSWSLSCSRHHYAELVFDQSIETWLLCHRACLRRSSAACPPGSARQPQGRDRARRALSTPRRSAATASAPSTMAFSSTPARRGRPAQGQGGAGWRPLRQTQLPGRPLRPRRATAPLRPAQCGAARLV